MFLAMMSGWINPLIVAYLACDFWPKIAVARPYIAVATLACVGATWVYLFNTAVMIGNVMWIASVFILLAPEINRWRFNMQRAT